MKQTIGDIAGTSLAAVLTAVQTNQVFQAIELGITILIGVLTIVNIIRRWFKEAKEDGKITADEVHDLVDELSDEAERIENEIKDKERKD